MWNNQYALTSGLSIRKAQKIPAGLNFEELMLLFLVGVVGKPFRAGADRLAEVCLNNADVNKEGQRYAATFETYSEAVNVLHLWKVRCAERLAAANGIDVSLILLAAFLLASPRQTVAHVTTELRVWTNATYSR